MYSKLFMLYYKGVFVQGTNPVQMTVVLINFCVKDNRLCTYLAWATSNEMHWGFKGSALIKVSIPIKETLECS